MTTIFQASLPDRGFPTVDADGMPDWWEIQLSRVLLATTHAAADTLSGLGRGDGNEQPQRVTLRPTDPDQSEASLKMS
jgi:hypothetical protein